MTFYIGKVLPVLATTAILAGCASMGPPLPPSLALPKPPADLQARRKGDKVFLTWTVPTSTTDKLRVRYFGPTLVCRGVAILKECGNEVAKVPAPASVTPDKTSEKSGRRRSSHTEAEQKPSASYTDAAFPRYSPKAGSAPKFITYAVEALNRDGHGAGLSNQVQISSAPTLAPPDEFRAEVIKDGVQIAWAPMAAIEKPASISYRVRIYRREESSKTGLPLGDVPYGAGSLPRPDTVRDAEPEKHEQPADQDALDKFVDQALTWEKTYYYRATVMTVVTAPGKPVEQIEGDDTTEVRVFAHDVFPPAVPAGLQAVFSGPGQETFVDLIWAPVTDADLAGYNIYRRESGGTPQKLNTEIVRTAAYRDPNVASGKRYAYSVSAVDVRGNESARSEEAAESVP